MVVSEGRVLSLQHLEGNPIYVIEMTSSGGIPSKLPKLTHLSINLQEKWYDGQAVGGLFPASPINPQVSG